jgi:hypothetical protein
VYYGIAMDEKHLYVACRNEVEGPTDASAREKERGSILVFDAASLTLITELCPSDFPLRDVHGAAFIDGKLFVTCTYDNLIAIYDTLTGRWDKWYPALDPSARDYVNHLNTVVPLDDKIGVLAHNMGPGQLWYSS